MSRVPGGNDGGGGGAGLLERRSRRTGASVTLRQNGDLSAESGSLMDPATKSLADALRITFRVLQFAILLLIAAYILSGFQRVNETERGIRLSLGKVVDEDLSPGFQFSLPAPFGELVKVPVGEQREELRKEFFPNISEAEEKNLLKDGVQTLAGGGGDSLDPSMDGALVTADGNLAHARASVTFRRTSTGKWARNINDERPADPTERTMEQKVVLACVKQGVIQAAASMSIDELIKGQADAGKDAGKFRTAEDLAREIAQKSLDKMDAGIQLQQLSLTLKIAPRRVMPEFNNVQSAESKAGTEIEKARDDADKRLLETAGQASPVLLTQIDRYEAELERGETAKAAATLKAIDDMLQQKPTQIDGKPVEAVASGEVTARVSQAQQARGGAVNEAKAAAALFAVKREAYRNNPRVFLTAEWGDAFGTFLSGEYVQTMWLPPNMARMVVQINRDPRILKQLETDEAARKYDAAAVERNRNRERARFEQRMDGEIKTRDGR